jgi:hypothetical protein
MCKECEQGIIEVLTRLEKETDDSGNAYIEAFANLNDEDNNRLNAVMAAYNSINQLMHYRQRHEALESFQQKIVRTINKGGEFGKAIYLWWTYMHIHARFDLVLFHSISINNGQLKEWMNAYAKRQNR